MLRTEVGCAKWYRVPTTEIYLDYFDNKEEGERQRDEDEEQRAQSYEVGKHSRSFLALSLVTRLLANIELL